jgi:predicted nucleic acid-binding protein
VALARILNVPLITADNKIVKAFPQYAIALEAYSAQI